MYPQELLWKPEPSQALPNVLSQNKESQTARSLRSLCRDQILESYHRHLTVQQDRAAPSETHGELDEPETPSQATHTPGEETES